MTSIKNKVILQDNLIELEVRTYTGNISSYIKLNAEETFPIKGRIAWELFPDDFDMTPDIILIAVTNFFKQKLSVTAWRANITDTQRKLHDQAITLAPIQTSNPINSHPHGHECPCYKTAPLKRGLKNVTGKPHLWGAVM